MVSSRIGVTPVFFMIELRKRECKSLLSSSHFTLIVASLCHTKGIEERTACVDAVIVIGA